MDIPLELVAPPHQQDALRRAQVAQVLAHGDELLKISPAIASLLSRLPVTSGRLQRLEDGWRAADTVVERERIRRDALHRKGLGLISGLCARFGADAIWDESQDGSLAELPWHRAGPELYEQIGHRLWQWTTRARTLVSRGGSPEAMPAWPEEAVIELEAMADEVAASRRALMDAMQVRIDARASWEAGRTEVDRLLATVVEIARVLLRRSGNTLLLERLRGLAASPELVQPPTLVATRSRQQAS